jgi:hypothetical protein
VHRLVLEDGEDGGPDVTPPNRGAAPATEIVEKLADKRLVALVIEMVALPSASMRPFVHEVSPRDAKWFVGAHDIS